MGQADADFVDDGEAPPHVAVWPVRELEKPVGVADRVVGHDALPSEFSCAVLLHRDSQSIRAVPVTITSFDECAADESVEDRARLVRLDHGVRIGSLERRLERSESYEGVSPFRVEQLVTPTDRSAHGLVT